MAHSEICCGLYRGRIFLQDRSDASAALLPVGNAELTVNQTLTEINQPNYQSLGGNNCQVSFVENTSFDLVLHCTSPENLALAFLGQAAQRTGATVTDEVHPVNAEGELIPFDFVPNKGATITVTGPSGSPTYVEGTDYVVTNAGIEILHGTSIPVDGSNIEVSYTYGNNWYVDAQTLGQKEYYLVLDGFNAGEGDGGRPFVLKAWKVKFSPAESFAIISGTEFASLSVSGEILRDDSKATGSKFFTIEWGSEGSGSGS